MILKNCNLFGKNVNIKIENGKFTEVGDFSADEGIDIGGNSVIPGLIDTHIHGCNGHDTLDMGFAPMCDFLAKNGTTAWFPTLVTTSFDNMKKVTEKIPDVKGAEILGYHLEGPYISKEYKGAHNEKYIKNPDINEIKSLKNIRLMTIAPELENAISVISECDFSISLGHTACDYETAKKAFLSGAESVTHTFNAMKPLHHRRPNLLGAAFEHQSYAEVIADGFHVHPVNVLMLYKLFGDKLILVSDALECTGFPDGKYMLGGKEFTMKNHTATYEDGTIVGGTHTLFECVKCAVSFGIPFKNAVKAASEVPAKRFGLKKGKIEKGYDADMIILTKDMNIKDVILKGEFYK